MGFNEYKDIEVDEELATCVCDTLLAIAEAQDQIEDEETSTCKNSCDKYVSELLGEKPPRGKQNNTIPVALTVRGTGDLFVGTGVKRKHNGLKIGRGLVFKVINVDADTCCATLQLLQFVDADDIDKELEDVVPKLLKKLAEGEGYDDTDVCITVDLNCFCAVTCFPPTRSN